MFGNIAADTCFANFPACPGSRPGDTIAALPGSAPTKGEDMSEILAAFQRLIMPGITHWNHPSFFAYFAISASIPGILGELLAAGLDTDVDKSRSKGEMPFRTR